MVNFRHIMSVKDGIITYASKRLTEGGNISKRAIAKDFPRKVDTFREGELFVENKDFLAKDLQYGLDELKLASNTNPTLASKINDLNSKILDTDLEVATLLDTGERKYLDTVFAHNTGGNRLIQKYIFEGLPFQTVANIVHKAKGFMIEEYVNDAMNLIKEKYPLNIVLKSMDDCKINKGLNYTYTPGFMKFVTEFPNKKHLVITKNNKNLEVIDEVAVKNFRALNSLTQNEQEIEKVLTCCRYKGKYETTTDHRMLNYALMLLEKEKSWSDTSSEIINLLKNKLHTNKSSENYNKYKHQIELLIEKNKSTEEIYKALLQIE